MILANDNDYINFVKDKNVIIVGSAGYLMNQNKGEWINSFDIVVRINNSIPIEFPNDYGKRTDILYHILFKHANITKNKKRDTNEEDIKLYEKNNVKYLIARSSLSSPRAKKIINVKSDKISFLSIHGKQRTPSINIDFDIGKPNTGVLAIMHLLYMPVKSLTVVGFDFYKSGYHNKYDGFEDGSVVAGCSSTRHNFKAQLKYLEQHYRKQNGRLILDDALLSQFNNKEMI